MEANDNSAELIGQVQEAINTKTSVRIVGGDSKTVLGEQVNDEDITELCTLKHSGIISYDPTELVVTVRAGTRLSELNKVLNDAGQMMPFEPPEQTGATVGGVLACGLSGPRRPFSGSARDYVLGTRIINGQAQDLAFGGEVMKNVAGYDVSRVQVGAWGTLGVLLDVSMKVLPVPDIDLTLRQQTAEHDLSAFAAIMRQPLPLSGAMLIGDSRYLRLSGSEAAVRAAALSLGGDTLDDNAIWSGVRDHTHPFFTGAYAACANGSDKTLWRISVADYQPALELSGDWLYEWAGGQRWLLTEVPADTVFNVVAAAQGHATRYSESSAKSPSFQPIEGGLQKLHTRLRDSFDPLRVFNRGRYHPELDVPSSPAVTGA